MTSRPTLPAGFDEAFDNAQSSAFRLETLQTYVNSGEDPALDAFLSGRPHVLTPGKREWTSLVRDRRRTGCMMQRVHVVTEPPSDYMTFELTWGYAPNVAAGEDIRIIPVNEGSPWPTQLPRDVDFWLFDDATLYAMSYAPEGTWLGAELVADPARIDEAIGWRSASLRLATPWREYIRSRQHLQRFVEAIPQAS